jgi:hypothetical protein
MPTRSSFSTIERYSERLASTERPAKALIVTMADAARRLRRVRRVRRAVVCRRASAIGACGAFGI